MDANNNNPAPAKENTMSEQITPDRIIQELQARLNDRATAASENAVRVLHRARIQCTEAIEAIRHGRPCPRTAAADVEGALARMAEAVSARDALVELENVGRTLAAAKVGCPCSPHRDGECKCEDPCGKCDRVCAAKAAPDAEAQAAGRAPAPPVCTYCDQRCDGECEAATLAGERADAIEGRYCTECDNEDRPVWKETGMCAPCVTESRHHGQAQCDENDPPCHVCQDTRPEESCPGCGCQPGDGRTEGCTDADGCGFDGKAPGFTPEPECAACAALFAEHGAEAECCEDCQRKAGR